jgi:hypothetical protein
MTASCLHHHWHPLHRSHTLATPILRSPTRPTPCTTKSRRHIRNLPPPTSTRPSAAMQQLRTPCANYFRARRLELKLVDARSPRTCFAASAVSSGP